MAPLSLPIAMNGDTGLSRLRGSSRTNDIASSAIILHQEPRPVEGIAHADGRNLCVNASLPRSRLQDQDIAFKLANSTLSPAQERRYKKLRNDIIAEVKSLRLNQAHQFAS
jgi:hypothetical protein